MSVSAHSSEIFECRSENRFTMLMLAFFIFISKNKGSGLILLTYHYISTQSVPHFRYLSHSGKNVCYILISSRVLLYQPSCRNCFHLAIVFKFVGTTDDYLADIFMLHKHIQYNLFCCKIEHHVHLFSHVLF